MKQKIKHFILTAVIMFTANAFAQAQDIEINETNFPDATFRNWLLNSANIGGVGADGILTPSEIASIEKIEFLFQPGFIGSGKKTYDMTGLEYFYNLTELRLTTGEMNVGRVYQDKLNEGVFFTNIDVSRMTRLTTFSTRSSSRYSGGNYHYGRIEGNVDLSNCSSSLRQIDLISTDIQYIQTNNNLYLTNVLLMVTDSDLTNLGTCMMPLNAQINNLKIERLGYYWANNNTFSYSYNNSIKAKNVTISSVLNRGCTFTIDNQEIEQLTIGAYINYVFSECPNLKRVNAPQAVNDSELAQFINNLPDRSSKEVGMFYYERNAYYYANPLVSR